MLQLVPDLLLVVVQACVDLALRKSEGSSDMAQESDDDMPSIEDRDGQEDEHC